MKNLSWLTLVLILSGSTCFAQVDDIKKSSKENSGNRSRSNSSDRGGSGSGNFDFFIDMFRVLGAWQSYVLQKKSEIPSLVGFVFMLHGAIQPSSYYVVNPRIRGTWGIFSTDFRTNYMLEETITGNSDLLSYDWQVIQLNFINTKHVIVRAGTGFMKENYGGHQTLSESGLSTNLMFNDNRWGGFAEYRSAHDYNNGDVARREFSLQAHRQLFASGHWHGLASGGFQFQRYYSSINVWGIQMGLVLRYY